VEKSAHSPEYCLQRAIHCEDMAEQTGIPANREILLNLAAGWRAAIVGDCGPNQHLT
jgi:hypothetical protein